MSKVPYAIHFFFLLCFVCLFSGCVSPDLEPYAADDPWTPGRIEQEFLGHDPIEQFNRGSFAVNDFLMTYVADPIGRVWSTILPRPVITCIRNVCVNIEYPGRLVSNLGSAEWNCAWDETVRFFINSTLGIGGLFDPAKHWFHYYPSGSDFGLMLHAWGVEPGCTFVFPLTSFLNVRDAGGTVLDYAFDPKTYLPYTGWTYVNTLVVNEKDYRAALEGSRDRYATFRRMLAIRRKLQEEKIPYRVANKSREEQKCAVENPPPLPPDVQVAEVPAHHTATYLPIPKFYPEGDFADCVRAGILAPQKSDDPWFMRLSLFNSDFPKKMDRHQFNLHPDTPKAEYGFFENPPPKDGPRKRKLAVIMPGLGTPYDSASAVAMAELFWNDGYDVAVTDCVFSWRSMRSILKGKFPGHVVPDNAQFREFLAGLKRDLEIRGILPENVETVLVGWSFGALHALFLAKAEEAQDSLNISRYIALNPPVNLHHALNTLDSLLDASKGMTRDRVEALFRDMGAKIAPHLDFVHGEDSLQYQTRLSEEQAKLLVGLFFRYNVYEVLAESIPEELHRNEKRTLLRSFDSINFKQYADTFVSRSHNGLGAGDMAEQGTLRSIPDTLKNNQKIRIIHAANDYLLAPDDLPFLDRLLGTRMTVFLNGSHCGYYYTKEAKERILGAANGVW